MLWPVGGVECKSRHAKSPSAKSPSAKSHDARSHMGKLLLIPPRRPKAWPWRAGQRARHRRRARSALTILLGLGTVVVALAAARLLSPNQSQTLRASATAVDVDTLRFSQQLIRLQGIDAPELDQQCQDEQGQPWPCGREARLELARLLSRGLIACAPQGADRYGRTLARCSGEQVGDLGDSMVRAGLAVAFMGWRYALAEREAKTHRRGLWRGSFEKPQDWRRRRELLAPSR
jgi:endonuclease YncB( thermonuclease family)